MRTDLKIGIAMLLILGGVIVVYNVFIPGGQISPQIPPPPLVSGEPHGNSANKGDSGSLYASAGNDRVIESLDRGFTQPRQKTSSSHKPAEQSPHDPAERNNVQSGTNSETARNTANRKETLRKETPALTPVEKIYIVKEGDDGFWAVAQNVYSHGKYWHLIAKANPDADSNVLFAGQKLKIPPLPSSRRGEVPVGKVIDGSAGKRYYYVQEGDKGFWGISQKVYKDGKYWAKLKKANPNVDSMNLRKGQKILIPALPGQSGTSGSVSPPAPRRLPEGYKWYTVQKGDAGFCDVAKKNYGTEKHWELIAKANPNVKTSRLRPGKKLAIPPQPQKSATTENRQP